MNLIKINDSSLNNNSINNNNTLNNDNIIKKKNDECLELKSINYKNMLLKGSNLSFNEEKYDNSLILDSFLEKESMLNKKEHWIKLDKPEKIIKIKKYGEKLIEKYKLNKDEIDNMYKFFTYCIDNKKINKIKDIDYNKIDGEIKDISIILFNDTSRNFYLKKSDKHISTLKSIPPKKNKTIKS